MPEAQRKEGTVPANRPEPAAGGPDAIRVELVRLPGCEDLPIPTYQTRGSAGADLPAAVDGSLVVRPGEIHLVPTGLRMAIPEGFEGQVRPRSGLAARGVTVVNAPGTIDADYRGEVKVLLTCLAREPVVLHRGDRIAQIVFGRVARADFAVRDELDDTPRGEGGFGHTGTATR